MKRITLLTLTLGLCAAAVLVILAILSQQSTPDGPGGEQIIPQDGAKTNADTSFRAPGKPSFSSLQLIPAQAREPITAIGFTDAEGQKTGPEDFEGQVVLLNLWATWCGPCIVELPSLLRLKEKLAPEDFALIALSVDRDGPQTVAPFLEKEGLTGLPVYYDKNLAASRALHIPRMPTTILMDRSGREAARIEGAHEWDGEEALSLIRQLLAEEEN